MHQLNAYLLFDGTCADVMGFYERSLGGELGMMTQADAPIGGHAAAGTA